MKELFTTRQAARVFKGMVMCSFAAFFLALVYGILGEEVRGNWAS